MYDTIIIGAEPAGCAAAELAANGHSALIVEKFGLPRNKSCSGILASGGMARASFEQVIGLYAKKLAGLKHYMERQWNFTGAIADTFKEMKLQSSKG